MTGYQAFLVACMVLQTGAVYMAYSGGDLKMAGFWVGIILSNVSLAFVK